MDPLAVWELGCGCESVADPEGRVALLSYCATHRPDYLRCLFMCGECGFASIAFDRMERHVYRVHLGVQVA
jgi:hypothetical protein